MRDRSSTTGRRAVWPLLFAFILVVSACGGTASSSAPGSAAPGSAGPESPAATTAPSTAASEAAAAEPQTIVFLTVHSQDQLQPLLDGFKKIHPEITVEYEQVPFVDLQNILLQRLGSKSKSPDVFYMDPTNIPAFSDRGLLEPMPDSYIAEAATLMSHAAATGSMYGGKMMTMPVWGSAQILFYNKKLLAAAGVEAPPSSPDARWTWESLNRRCGQGQGGRRDLGLHI